MEYLIDNIYVPGLNDGEKLYHYTNVSGFQGICNGEFWVTESSFLNDKTELSIATEIFCKLVDKHVLNKNVCEELKKIVIDHIKEQINYQNINNNIVKLDSSYILSFSLYDDNLSLWSQFTNNNGYCMSFDFKDLVSSFDENANFISGKVIYDPIIQMEILKKDIEQLFFDGKIFSNWEEFNNMTTEKIADIYQALATSISVYNLFFKLPCFKAENEFRFVFFRYNQINEYSFDQFFRIKDNLLIPYIKIKTSTLNSLKEVVIGPENNSDIAKLSVLRYFNNLDIKADVKLSTVPIR